jgi:hypothetical protein
MIMRTGIAQFSLDWGKCPRWLFERMVRLGRIISLAIIGEFGPDEFLRRLADPVWFQSLGCVMAFDWNASGLTTTVMGALKEVFKERGEELGIFVCGGKGKVSRRTPEEISFWTQKLNWDNQKAEKLIYASRATAKVDSSLIQDGFQIYHHNFIFTQTGKWVVIQQGMNIHLGAARRYHWLGEMTNDFIEEPHAGIASSLFLTNVLDLTAKESKENREISLALIQDRKILFSNLHRLEIIRYPKAQLKFDFTQTEKKLDPLFLSTPSSNISPSSFKYLFLANKEFRHHPIEKINFNHPQLRENFNKLTILKPSTFEQLLMTEGVGSKTIRALSLVAEIIYGARPSYEDPARYTFAYGGKDGTPYPVDRKTYDKTLEVMEKALRQSQLYYQEKDAALRRLEKVIQVLNN